MDGRLRIANDLLRLLPERYRHNPLTHRIKMVIQRQPAEHLRESDFTMIVAAKDRGAVTAQGLSDSTAPRRTVG
jgi:hypothetical protein